MKKGVLRKAFSRVAYRHRVAAVIYLFILLPFLVLGLLIVRKLWNDKVQDILEQNRGSLRLGVEAVDRMLFSGLLKLSFINTNSMIRSYLEKGDFSDLAYDFAAYNSIERTIDALLVDSPSVGVVIYPTDQRAYNGEYVEKLERLERRLGSDDTGLMQGLQSLDWDGQLWRYERERRAGDTFNNLGYVCCYKKMQVLNRTLAVTELHIDVSRIIGSFQGGFPKGSRVIYRPDDFGDLVVMESAPGASEAPVWTVVSDTPMSNAGDYYPIEIRLNYSPGAFTLLIPHGHIRSQLTGFLLVAILAVMISVTVLFVIVELASYLITRRLSRLIDNVNESTETASGAPDTVRYSADDDIGRLEGKFFSMLQKVREGYERMLEHENERKTFELELLQSQINPHFLYNALSTLKWNCRDERMANAIDSMVLYYRLALNKGDSVVKVSHEMKLVEEYLKIQRYTYESDFTYRFQVDEPVMESLTIRHLLQPVVENALMHGIRGLASGGLIEISGKLNDGIITFTVSDNGLGMPEETVRQLLCGEYQATMGGYGIRNVRRRINLYYGPRSTLSLASSPGKGTTAVISVPAVFEGRSPATSDGTPRRGSGPHVR